ncbi:substrate-binding periplasmic protein [Motiliproteus coralliicola]|uniref:substrate-binding periplasmic protein n=1 Tax=Motiliproteus coralliicola TaxID=2283196 RepID=UPI0014020EEA|nr:transporter substrate-binding domain-containing protein [Motiliproteus coralliicola]
MKSIAWFLLLLVHPFAVGADTTARNLLIAAPEFAPYVSSTLAEGGWAWEVLEAAFEGSDYQPKLQLLPWPRAVRMVEEGALDGLYLANKTAGRERWARFSEPVGDEVTLFWKNRDNRLSYRDIGDARGLRLGALRDSVQMETLQSEGFDAVALNDFEQGIRLLIRRRLDLVLADHHVIKHLLQSGDQPGQEKIIPIFPAVAAHGFHLAVSRQRADNDAVIEAFNQGLERLHLNGRYREIVRRYGLSPETVSFVPSQ